MSNVFLSVAPKLIVPDVVTVKAGTKMKIEALVSGKPPPTTKWKIGNEDVLTSDRISVQRTPNSTTLMIKDVTRKDSGYYSLAVSNSVSKINQIIRVIVMGEFTLFSTDYQPNGKNLCLELKSH